MTRQVRRKLHSRDGVTILFALLGFLAAAMAAFVIVTAAINNESRIRGQRSQQQTYLALSSAASLLRETVSDTRVGRVVRNRNEGNADYSYSGPGGALGDALMGLSGGLVEGSGASTADRTLYLNVNRDGVEDAAMAVTIRLSLNAADRQITALIQSADGSSMTLVFSGLAWKLDYSVVAYQPEDENGYREVDYVEDHYSLFFPADGIYVSGE